MTQPATKPEATKPVRGRWHQKGAKSGMNTLEKAYSETLEAFRLKGEIYRWDFAVERFKLADGAWYLPDFRVLLPSGAVHFVEVKGFQEPTGRLKIKMAAEVHPYRFFQVTKKLKRDGGGWAIEEINPRTEELC